MNRVKGFTLIELMIVVGIIGILALIALPVYRDQVRNAAVSACMGEVRGYVVVAIAAIADGNASIPVPTTSACLWITDLSAMANPAADTQILAYPVSPGHIGIRCNLNSDTSCRLDTTGTIGKTP